MFEKRVIPGKTYCVTAYCPIVVSSVLNNTEVILVDTSEPGQYFFVAPTTAISSSISPNYILEVKGGGAGDSGNSGSGNGVGISFEKVADFDSLPETGKLGTIYLVPTEDTDNQWTEYVYIDGRYEIIGSKDFTMPDMSQYANLNTENTFTKAVTINNALTITGNLNAEGSGYTGYSLSELHPVQLLQNNTIYRGGEFATLTLTLPETINPDFICELAFTSGETATILNAPEYIKWAGSSVIDGIFTPDVNTRYSCFVYSDGLLVRGISNGGAI